jgi:hypothetical protein
MSSSPTHQPISPLALLPSPHPHPPYPSPSTPQHLKAPPSTFLSPIGTMPPARTEAITLKCGTCFHIDTYLILAEQQLTACNNCLTNFRRRERRISKNEDELTSFPRLLEEERAGERERKTSGMGLYGRMLRYFWPNNSGLDGHVREDDGDENRIKDGDLDTASVETRR